MTITEPATLVTDYLMGGLAAFWAFRLGASPVSQARSEWRYAFAFLAVSSFFGGSYHGFYLILGEPLARLMWHATLVAAALSSYFLLRAGVAQFQNPVQSVHHRNHSGLIWFAHVKLAAVLLTGAFWPDFLLVLVDFGISILVVIFLISRGAHHSSSAGKHFMLGVGLFMAGALVQMLGLAPHARFNHNDLFHVLQILGNWMFYRCAMSNEER